MNADLTIARVQAEEVLDLRWHVLRAGRPRHTAHMPGDEGPETRHWAALHAGVVVGCATVMRDPFPDDDGPAWRLRGMAVDGSLQGTGVGGRLLTAVHDEVAAALWCDARLRAVPFYLAHGWRVVSEVYEVPQVGPHHRMVWEPS